MTTPTTRTVKVHELLQGDVVLDEDAQRLFAVVELERIDRWATVRIWTDRRHNQDDTQREQIDLDWNADLLILRTTALERATTPAFIGGGDVVHLLLGTWTQETARGAGIELDALCGARRRIGSRSMFLPGVTVKLGVSPTCRRCEKSAARRATWTT